MYYEHKKHDGSLPIIGVNKFKGDKQGHIEGGEQELRRSTTEEKDRQVSNVTEFRDFRASEAKKQLSRLQKTAWERKNTFKALMEVAQCCSLGSMSHALYDVGWGVSEKYVKLNDAMRLDTARQIVGYGVAAKIFHSTLARSYPEFGCI